MRAPRVPPVPQCTHCTQVTSGWHVTRLSKVYRVSGSALTVIHLESWAALSRRGATVTRDGSAVGTIDDRWLRDVNRQFLARHKASLTTTRPTVRLPDGTVIACGYSKPNPSSDSKEYEDTFMPTVTAALTDPLATLVLVCGLTLPEHAHYEPPSGGG